MITHTTLAEYVSGFATVVVQLVLPCIDQWRLRNPIILQTQLFSDAATCKREHQIFELELMQHHRLYML